MIDAVAGRPRHYVPRVAIEAELLDGARTGTARLQVIEAPRGAGKSALLRQVASQLAARQTIVPLLDLERLCTTPAAFATGFTSGILRAVSASLDSTALPRSARILSSLNEEAVRRRPDPARLLHLALSYPEAVASEANRPLALLLDEAAEIARLSRHSGLRDCLRIVAEHLGGGSLTVIATVSPASRPAPLLDLFDKEAGGAMRRLRLPPLDERELSALLSIRGCPAAPRGSAGGSEAGSEISLWMNATNGHPLYAEILARRVAAGEDLASALAAELYPPLGALHQECRFDYHLLVERSRGHAAVRAILHLLAREEGATLSRVAGHLRVALPTALDYLAWLLEVGLIRRDGQGYLVADPLLGLWVRLNGPEPAGLLEEVAAFLERPRPAPRPPARPRGRRPGTRAPRRPSMRPYVPDLRIEID
ncbi:MAG TPA: ATP-binding protein [Candidatus Polarisedimenticolia bacterium]|jgi:hypothetical protein